MKYVVIKVKEDGYTRVFPIIFAEYQTHSVVAALAIAAIDHEFKKTGTPLTAGTCWTTNDEWKCIHGSESLSMPKNKSCNALDANILNMPNALQGIILIPEDEA
jgi:hypothetical protein